MIAFWVFHAFVVQLQPDRLCTAVGVYRLISQALSRFTMENFYVDYINRNHDQSNSKCLCSTTWLPKEKWLADSFYPRIFQIYFWIRIRLLTIATRNVDSAISFLRDEGRVKFAASYTTMPVCTDIFAKLDRLRDKKKWFHIHPKYSVQRFGGHAEATTSNQSQTANWPTLGNHQACESQYKIHETVGSIMAQLSPQPHFTRLVMLSNRSPTFNRVWSKFHLYPKIEANTNDPINEFISLTSIILIT